MKKSRWNTLRGYIFKNAALENDSARQQIKMIQAYQNVFQDEFGNLTQDAQIVIKDLIRRGYVGNSVAMLTDTRTIDVNATFIAEGKRTLVLEILEMLNLDLMKAIQLVEENDNV